VLLCTFSWCADYRKLATVQYTKSAPESPGMVRALISRSSTTLQKFFAPKFSSCKVVCRVSVVCGRRGHVTLKQCQSKTRLRMKAGSLT
jgi:hypothetical protein